jgi:phosphoribosylamine--glycine ligase
MRVIVIGAGGREHALAWRLAASPSVRELKVWPGNGGTAQAGWALAAAAPAAAADPSAQAAALAALAPDLVVIGPEAPLVAGLADALRMQGIAVFGPGAAGAQLEGSKLFAKAFCERHGLPTARAWAVATATELEAALAALGERSVLKADGLAGGKGVLLCDTRAEARSAGAAMLAGSSFGEAGRRLLVEERLEGYEVSLLAVCDGERFCLLPPSQDHKRVGAGDRGPNTGGMGAYSPIAPIGEAELLALGEPLIASSLAGLRAEGIDYRGLLYAGLMMTEAGPRLLEFNCRFGDPETQAVLPRVAGDFGRLLASAAAGSLEPDAISLRPEASLCVVLAAEGYPGDYSVGHAIRGLEPQPGDGQTQFVFHAGTREVEGRLVTAGGRVLAVTALGRDLPQAAERCYRRLDGIRYANRYLRRDIGWRALSRGGTR